MLLISDANIFIDLDKIGLVDIACSISDTIVTTDFVFGELYESQQKLIQNIGIEILLFEPDELVSLQMQYSTLGSVGISVPDFSLVVKAEENNGTVLSGDKALRSFSRRRDIDVKGIFYIFDRILEESLLSIDEWKEKLKELQSINNRLPQNEFEKRFNK